MRPIKSLSVRIPVELEQALALASAQQGLSKSALARQALQRALQVQSSKQASASHWVARWRGSLKTADETVLAAERLANLQAKHRR